MEAVDDLALEPVVGSFCCVRRAASTCIRVAAADEVAEVLTIVLNGSNAIKSQVQVTINGCQLDRSVDHSQQHLITAEIKDSSPRGECVTAEQWWDVCFYDSGHKA